MQLIDFKYNLSAKGIQLNLLLLELALIYIDGTDNQNSRKGTGNRKELVGREHRNYCQYNSLCPRILRILHNYCTALCHV